MYLQDPVHLSHWQNGVLVVGQVSPGGKLPGIPLPGGNQHLVYFWILRESTSPNYEIKLYHDYHEFITKIITNLSRIITMFT